jgi:hypothetical protein
MDPVLTIFRLTAVVLAALLSQIEDARPGESPDWVVANATPCAAAPAGDASALVRQVLGAGGTPEAQLERYENQFHRLADALRASGQVVGGERQKARAIHAFMHRRILRGAYETSGSDLAATLDGGAFNCATASAVFLALAAELDLDAWAVSAPGHVWCRVATSAGPLDVETTCGDWFDILARDASGASGRVAKTVADQQRRGASARVLDERAFLAVFHYNRGVQLLRQGRFHAAARANLTALTLDPQCQQAHDNLLATINNWSVALAAAGQGDLGQRLLAQGLALAPGYRPFHVNQRFISTRKNASRERPTAEIAAP